MSINQYNLVTFTANFIAHDTDDERDVATAAGNYDLKLVASEKLGANGHFYIITNIHDSLKASEFYKLR